MGLERAPDAGVGQLLPHGSSSFPGDGIPRGIRRSSTCLPRSGKPQIKPVAAFPPLQRGTVQFRGEQTHCVAGKANAFPNWNVLPLLPQD